VRRSTDFGVEKIASVRHFSMQTPWSLHASACVLDAVVGRDLDIILPFRRAPASMFCASRPKLDGYRAVLKEAQLRCPRSNVICAGAKSDQVCITFVLRIAPLYLGISPKEADRVSFGKTLRTGTLEDRGHPGNNLNVSFGPLIAA